MRGFMLTEDIDSSMRVVEEGRDDHLGSGSHLARARSGHASGALESAAALGAGLDTGVVRHLRPMLKRPGAPLRSRIGAFYLLAWREIYPWVSLQMFPLLAFWLLRGDPPDQLVRAHLRGHHAVHAERWPGAGAVRLEARDPSIKEHKRWFVLFLLSSLLFYTELKNIIVRTAHLKELMGETHLEGDAAGVGPRSAGAPGGVERRDPHSVGAVLRGDLVPEAAPYVAPRAVQPGSDRATGA